MMRTLPEGDARAALYYQILNESDDPAELEAASLWLEANPEKLQAFENIGHFMAVCDHVAATLPTQEVVAELGEAGGTDRRLWSWAWRAAASLVLVAAGAAFFILGRYDERTRIAGTSATQYATKIGEVRSVGLADRSNIVLSGASAVTVTYGRDFRRVTLNQGQAVFKVAHDPARPFTVATQSGTVRALGTEFDVHRSSAGTRVTVVEGVVDVTARSPDRVAVARLRPNMQIAYSSAGEMSPIMKVDAARMVDWQRGTLRFVAEPLSAVVADLNRFSTRPIIVENSVLAGEEITGTARIDGILEWLYALSESMGMTIEVSKNGAILLRGDGRRPTTTRIVSEPAPRREPLAGA